MNYSDKELEETYGILWRADQEKKENDLQKMIIHLQHTKGAPKNEDDDVYRARWDSYRAEAEVIQAQRRIRELHKEIENQTFIISQAEEIIKSYKEQTRSSSAARGRGRPENSEFNVRIAKKFVSQWVMSLMDVLEVKSCKKLEDIFCEYTTTYTLNKVTKKIEEKSILSKATERNWRRWLKGGAVPNYNTFVKLMDTEIKDGKFKGQLLQNIPATPNSNDLQTLLRFI